LALVLATGVTYIAYWRLRVGTAHAAVVQIVAAAGDLPAGVPLAARDLTMIDWPASAPLPGSFSKTDEVLGRPLIYSVGAKAPVLVRDLAVPGSGIGLSVKIPPGMRATAVRSNEIVGVAGFLFPGSHVDVLATITLPGSPSPVTQTILQDVEVLTAGEKIEADPQGKPQTVNVVTLLVNSEDSQKLLLAGALGTIQFVLRSGADELKKAMKPTVLSQLVSSVSPPAQVEDIRREATPHATPAPAAQVPPNADAYALEVIRGTSRSVETF